MKLNYMKSKNGKICWKQVESKDGKIFMRIKQRAITPSIEVFNQ